MLKGIIESIEKGGLRDDGVYIVNFTIRNQDPKAPKEDKRRLRQSLRELNSIRNGALGKIRDGLVSDGIETEEESDNVIDREYLGQIMQFVIGKDETTSIDAWRIVIPKLGYEMRDVLQYMTTSPEHALSLLGELSSNDEIPLILSDVVLGTAKKPEIKPGSLGEPTLKSRDYVDLLSTFHEFEPEYVFLEPYLNLTPATHTKYPERVGAIKTFVKRCRGRMVKDYGLHMHVCCDREDASFGDLELPVCVDIVPYMQVVIQIGMRAFRDLRDSAFRGMLYHSLGDAIHTQEQIVERGGLVSVMMQRENMTCRQLFDQFDKTAVEVFGHERDIKAYRRAIQHFSLRAMGSEAN